MGIFARTEWLRAEQEDVESDLSRVKTFLGSQEFIRGVGDRWHPLAASRAKAEATTIDLTAAGSWKINKLAGRDRQLRLSAWSASDGIEMNLAVTLDSRESSLSTLVVSGSNESDEGQVLWPRLLAAARLSVDALGGFALVSSTSLIRQAREGRRLKDPSRLGYAYFWGKDRSERNEAFRSSDRLAPRSEVIAPHWKHVPQDLDKVLSWAVQRVPFLEG